MLCPICGKEMEPGTINCPFHAPSGKVRFISDEEQKKKGLFAWKKRTTYVLDLDNIPIPRSYHCPDCHKVYMELNVEDRSYWDENY